MPKTRSKININKIKSDFLKLINYIHPLSAEENLKITSDSQLHRMVIQDGYGFIIQSEGIKFYMDIITEILSLPFFQRHYSETRLETELNRLIISYSIETDQSKRKKLLNSFEQNLKSKTKNWLIVFPVEGVKLLGIRSIKIGNCILRTYSNYQAKKLSYSANKWEINVKKDIDSKSEIVGKKRIIYIGLSNVNAYVNVNTSDQQPVKVGILRLEEYLNILRLFIPILEGCQSNIFIGINGLRPALRQNFYAKELETNNPHVSLSKMGQLGTLELNKRRILKLKKLKEINAIYKREIYDLNDFEKRLRNSINSFGKGIAELNPIDKFLSFMISIESLIGVERGGLTEHFCTVMNKIFTDRHDSIKSKLKSYQNFKDLYRVRSGFVHSGSDYINDRFVRSSQCYSLKLIFYMLGLKNKISNDTELSEYLIKLKLK